MTGAEIDFVDNPRKEAQENELAAANRQLLDLGLQPTTLQGDLMREVSEIAVRYKHRCDLDKIPARSQWVQRKSQTAPGRFARSTPAVPA
jgi:UDP-sulfoquinovose synthase